jgi:hypothetical protein
VKGKKESMATAATARYILSQLDSSVIPTEPKKEIEAGTERSPMTESPAVDQVRKLQKENARLRKERDDALG